MRRWAIRAAQLMSMLWATLFLTANLLHPLTHSPLQHDGSDCLACVLQKTRVDAPETPLANWRPAQTVGEPVLLPSESIAQYLSITSLPLVPRAPPV
jgi:hypothetical protein